MANWASGRKGPSRALRMNQAQLLLTSAARERNEVRRMRQREMKLALGRRQRQRQSRSEAMGTKKIYPENSPNRLSGGGPTAPGYHSP